jgi:putative DNA primase/helicase
MTFERFAAAHGLIIQTVEYGKWCRVPTEDHRQKKNGAYKHLGNIAFVQNHSLMPEPVTWKEDKNNPVKVDPKFVMKCRDTADRELAEGREKAAKKAGWILHQCKREQHAYLESKGFKDEIGLVWWKEEKNNLLVIPMRIGDRLVGCQTIDRWGEKKFLFGQQSSGAEFIIDNKGRDWYVEGYATGISLRAVLHALKIRYRIHVCFSAHNLTKLARGVHGAVIVADNDSSGVGEQAAKDAGCPYWMSEVIGQDLNDRHRAIGVFRLSQEIRKWIMTYDL